MNNLARQKTQRFYDITGFRHPVPSVTSVLNVVAKPGIVHWEKHMALKSMAEQVQEICEVVEEPLQGESGEGEAQARRLVPAEGQDLFAALQKTLFDREWMVNAVKTAKGAARREMRKAGDLGSRAHNLFEALAKGQTIPGDDEAVKPLVEGFTAWREAHPHLELLDVEKVVFSERFQFAGTLDATAVDISSLVPPMDEKTAALEAAKAACGLTTASSLTGANGDVKESRVGQASTVVGPGEGIESLMEKVGEKAKPRIVVLDWKTSNQTHNEYALQIAAYAKAYEEMTGLEVAEAWIVRFDKIKAKYQVSKVADIDQAYETFLSCLHLYHSLSGQFFAKESDEAKSGVSPVEMDMTEEEKEMHRKALESRRISMQAVERQRAMRQIEEAVAKTLQKKRAALEASRAVLPKQASGLAEADESLIAALQSNQKVF